MVVLANYRRERTVQPMNLGSRARRSFYSMKKDPDLPGWTAAIPVVGFVLLGLFLSSALFASQDSEDARQARSDAVDRAEQVMGSFTDDELAAIDAYLSGDTIPPDVNNGSASTTVPDGTATTVPDDTSTTFPDQPGTTTPDTAPPVVDGVAVPNVAGGVVTVADDALAVARAAARALFTGEFVTVPVAAGVAPPSLPATWADPLVESPTVESYTPSTFDISFLVDPDRDGETAPRTITVSVVVEGDRWVWAGI